MRIAHCLVGDPRQGFLENPTISQNIKENILLSLAPRQSEASLILFGIFHNPKKITNNNRLKDNHNGSLIYSNDLITQKFESLVYGESHLSIGDFLINIKPGCDSENARGKVPCCTKRSKNASRGMLITFWQDECYRMVSKFEIKQNAKFHWITKSRPDLVCILPLPFLGHLPITHVYTTVKERGELWDTLFIIPRNLLVSFRNVSMFAIERGQDEDCMSPGRNKGIYGTCNYHI